MRLWKVCKHFYINKDKPVFDVMPYKLWSYLKCCWKYYGIAGLKNCYLSKRRADHKAEQLNHFAIYFGEYY